jgi:catechol 2,3-dioxygenase-like lactoylglutathione lyase family enzyme
MRLDHAGLSVGDLDAAIAFYSRAFGFEPEFAFDLPIGDIHGVMLQLGTGGRLELFERPGSCGGLRADSPIDALATRGYGHVALDTADIDASFALALEAGATERISPRPAPEPGVRFAFVADPEGNLVELVERI